APANAFGGKLFHRGSSCCDPCAAAVTAGCGGCGAAAAGPVASAPIAAPPAAAAPVATPCTTTVRKTIMVPEWHDEVRTTCKSEMRAETYTATKTEMVQETRTRNVQVMKVVTDTCMETK